MESPSSRTLLVGVLLCLLIGGLIGLLIGQRRQASDEKRISRLEKTISSRQGESGRSAEPLGGDETPRRHDVVVPQNPNRQGGTFNASQPGGTASGGGMSPGAGARNASPPTDNVSTAGQ